MSNSKAVLGASFAMIVIWLTVALAWLTHVFVAIKYLVNGVESVGYVILLGLGVFVPPVGVIHGIGVWLGVW